MTNILTRLIAAAAGGLLAFGLLGQVGAATAAVGMRVPVPALASPAPTARLETAIFAGGCFWGVQGVYSHVNGVRSAVSGFAGGTARDANYAAVGNGSTGHAEAVRIVYDPRVVRYDQLLRIFFAVVADPTTLDYQGPDHGPQYRTAIFPTSEAQRRVAAAYVAQLGKAKLWPKPIVTRIERAQAFFPAEAYHQDYMHRHPDAPYIRINDAPKLAGLKALFPQHYRATPVLVGKRG